MAIDREVTALVTGRTAERILIIEAPPRHGKSEFISRYLPAWYLGRWPNKRVALTSYEANFARSWGRKCRDLLLEHGARSFGISVSREQNAAVDWEIAQHGGGMVAAGVGGPLTGRGADLLIVDDPIKNAEEALSERIRENQWEWWQSTAATRVEPGGCAIVMATRWHKDDLSGRLIEQSGDGGAPVRRLRLSAFAEDGDVLGRPIGEALWPERWPKSALEAKRNASDPYWWLALYQQRPSRHTRAEWPDSYFRDIWCDEEQWPDRFELSAIAVDPSLGKSGGDFQAVVFVGLSGGKLWVDSLMLHVPVESLVRKVIEFYQLYLPDYVGVEANAMQSLLQPIFEGACQSLRIPMLPLALVHNRGNKVELRIPRLGPYLMRGAIRLRQTGGNRVLLQQLEEFPLSDHDDGPDALETAIRIMDRAATGALT